MASDTENDPDHSDSKRQLTKLRTKATKAVREIETVCPESGLISQRKADELSFILEEADLIVEELKHASIGVDSKDSDHIRSLRMAIHVANRNLQRWEVHERRPAPVSPDPCQLPPSLLRVDIPKFGDGKVGWAQFWGLFKRAVHNQPSYGAAEKISLLLPLLVGRAASAVAGIYPEPHNYDEIIQILSDRFDRPGERKRELLNELYTYPQINVRSLGTMRTAVDRLVGIVRELTALSVDPETFSTAVEAHLEGCLPREWEDSWIRMRRKEGVTVDKFISFILEEMEVSEDRAAARKDEKGSFNSFPSSVKPANHSTSTVSALPNFVSRSPQGQQCRACDGPVHSLLKCEAFNAMTPRERDRVVRVARVCFNCLGPHGIKKCKSQFACGQCRKNHHTLLCFRTKEVRGGRPPNSLGVNSSFVQTRPSQSASTFVQPALNSFMPTVHMGEAPGRAAALSPNALPVQTSLPMTAMCGAGGVIVHPETPAPWSDSPISVAQQYYTGTATSSQVGTYPMVATCYASGEHGTQLVRLLYDSGADCSFIREEVATSIGLHVVETGTFACVGFQGRMEQRQSRSKVSCALVSRFGGTPINVRLWVVDRLCGQMKQRIIPNHPELFEIPLADDFRGGEVDIIIGNDLFYALVGTTQLQLTGTLRAIDTALGWVIHGCDERLPPDDEHRISTVSCLRVSSAWELEGLGIQPEPEIPAVRPIPQWNEGEQKVQVSLLWSTEDRPVSNRITSSIRVSRMSEKLNTKQTAAYNDFISVKMAENVISVAPASWYELRHQFLLPHRALFDGKFRVVFDGSAVDGRGRSLNSYMYSGPNMLQELITVLIRFRCGRVAMQADVKSAFHQVMIDPKDWPYVQFPYNGQTLYFRRLPFGLVCSPSLLHASIDFILSRAGTSGLFNSDLIHELRHALYFDDLLVPFQSRMEAEQSAVEAAEVFATGGMALHKIRISGDDVPPSSVLGMVWDTVADTMAVRFPEMKPVITKRNLMSLIGRVWDPAGLLCAWTIRVRLLFQQSWALDLKWDDRLPENLSANVTEWMNEVRCIGSISVPRLCAAQPFRVDCFVDASQVAYCAVVYLVDSDGKRNLLVAKSRLAPIAKKLTIPRLELMAALIGARLVRTVKASLRKAVLEVRFHSDSQDVLFWLQRRKPSKLFISNRVKEILDNSTVAEWFYVKTDMNPADLGTRGLKLKEVALSNMWWCGPPPDGTSAEPFVKSCSVVQSPSPAVLQKEHPEQEHSEPMAMAVVQPDYGPVIDLSRFSTLRTATRVTAYVMRIRTRLHNLRNEQARVPSSLAILPEEANEAQRFLMQEAQASCMPENYEVRLSRLNPALADDGIIYIRPRTGEKKRAYLPPESEFARLVIMDAHQRAFHMGTGATSSVLSSHFHTPRRAVKRIVDSCRRCRRYRGLQCRGEEGALPNFRSNFTRAFASIGIDYWGPLVVGERKKYVLLIACATSRAIHLELVDSQSAEDTSRAMRRFIAIRGRPSYVTSDNARSFRLLSTVMGITWKFLPERSPWWGGFYERLVGVTKRAIKTTLHGCTLSDDELRTTLYELSLFVNMRPLTPLEDSVALTPAHFVFGTGVDEILNPQIHGDVPITRALRNKEYKSKHLKQRWFREYLPTLREWNRPSKRFPVRVPQPGDVVLVQEDARPRGRWPIARIESLIVGSDGNSRAAYVKMKNIVTRRALQRLYMMEAVPRASDPVTDPVLPTGIDHEQVAQGIEPWEANGYENRRERRIQLPSSEIGCGNPAAGSEVQQRNVPMTIPISRRGRHILRPTRYND